MSSGYPEGNGQADAVPTTQIALRLPPADTVAVATHPACDHQLNRLTFNTIISFGRRAQNFYKSLQEISAFLPHEGESAIEAMRLITEQRKWMFDVGCAVGSVVGTFYQLEKNTLSELEVMWNTGQQDLTMKAMKKNFKATLVNLKLLESYRIEAEATIKNCEQHASKIVKWNGCEEQVQHAVMELLAKYGGSAQCKAVIQDLQKFHEEFSTAQEKVKKIETELVELMGTKDELQCKSIVYASIAANEQGSLSKLEERANQLDKEAAEKEKEAADTFNIGHKKRGFFGLGNWYTDWVDNKGDVARWRADRFKKTAAEAKKMEGNQQDKAKKAVEEDAKLKKQMTEVDGEIDGAKKNLEFATKARDEAERKLIEKRDQASKLSSNFGGLHLEQIASLRDHMQAFPALLGAQGMEDQGMFASMKGALKQHERLCNRLKAFLDEDDDYECKQLLPSLKSAVRQEIDNSHFFSEAMAPLKDAVEKSLKSIQNCPADMPIPTPSAPSQASSQQARAPENVDVVSLRDEEEDNLW